MQEVAISLCYSMKETGLDKKRKSETCLMREDSRCLYNREFRGTYRDTVNRFKTIYRGRGAVPVGAREIGILLALKRVGEEMTKIGDEVVSSAGKDR